MLVVEAHLQRKLGSEAPRGTILAIFVRTPMESNLNHRSSNHGKPLSYTTNPAKKTIKSEDTVEAWKIAGGNSKGFSPISVPN